jgi:hypothetical protein
MPPTEAGLQQLLHIGGYDLALPPASIQETPFRAETAERMANAFTVIDRPYLFAGAPDVIQKFTWQLAWPTANPNDSETFSIIESMPGFMDFCLWKPLVETFSGDGVATAFVLLRGLANVVLTPPAGTWTAVTKVAGSVVTNPTFGTRDATLGTTPVTFDSPPAAAASNIRIFYVPVFKVRVVSPARSFATPFAESRSLTIEEI